jgi:hypothetical protein
MIRNVTHSAFGRLGLVRAAFQLVRPLSSISGVMPFQVAKLSAITPNSGTIPKKTNIANAGRAIHTRTDPIRPPLDLVGS